MTELFKGKIQSSARFIENHFNFSKLKLDWNTFSFFAIIGSIVLLTVFALSYVMNENLERLEYTFLYISLVFIVAGILISFFVKSYVSSEICNSWKNFLSGGYFSRYFKVIEIAAVIAAALTLYIEFGFQRPQEREVRNAQLLAQIADLSSGNEEKKATTSPAVKNIMQLLARENVSMEGISVPRMNLYDALLADADLTRATLTETNLYNADLTDADLTDANLIDADLIDADLIGTRLIDADLTKADLNNATLTGANLAFADLIDADLTGADLTGADLTDADFTCAYLEETEFKNNPGLTQDMLDSALPFGAPKDNLPGGLEWKYSGTQGNAQNKCKNLTGFDLKNADLTFSCLTAVNLTKADLTEANFYGATLDRAILVDANLLETNGLTQDMLNSLRPSAPPRNLPDGLTWPFDKNEDGTWVRIAPAPASPN